MTFFDLIGDEFGKPIQFDMDQVPSIDKTYVSMVNDLNKRRDEAYKTGRTLEASLYSRRLDRISHTKAEWDAELLIGDTLLELFEEE